MFDKLVAQAEQSNNPEFIDLILSAGGMINESFGYAFRQITSMTVLLALVQKEPNADTEPTTPDVLGATETDVGPD